MGMEVISAESLKTSGVVDGKGSWGEGRREGSPSIVL